MPTLTAPIVGTQFRPPAAAVIRLLPINHQLLLQHEPLNEFDSNAVKVLIEMDGLPLDAEGLLAQHNYLPSDSPIHLGYVASSNNPKSCKIDNKPSAGNLELLRAMNAILEGTPHSLVVAHLTFSLTGQPLVSLLA